MGKGDPRGAEKRVTALLKERGWKLATAESCTGGLLASMLTCVPGVSEVYRGGFVTYVNEEKIRMLGVPASLIAVRGAVSKETARRMVLGTAQRCGADCAVSVTGNAGPSASEGKPVRPLRIAFACAGAWFRSAPAALIPNGIKSAIYKLLHKEQ